MGKMFGVSVRRAWPFILPATVFCLLMDILIAHFVREDQRADIVANTRTSASFLVSSFDKAAAGTEALLDNAIRAVLAERDPARRRLIPGEFRLPPGIVQLTIIGADGFSAGSSREPSAVVDLRDRQHFHVHQSGAVPRGQLFISEPVEGRISGEWTIQFTKAMEDDHGSFLGVLVASYSVAVLLDVLDRYPRQPGSLKGLVGRSGTVYARKVAGAPDQFGGAISSQDLHRRVLEKGSQSIEFVSSVDRMRRVGWIETSKEFPFYVVSAQPSPGFFSTIYPIRFIWWGLAATFLLFIMFYVIVLDYRNLNERIKIAEASSELSRLTSLGELAAGLGHEVATPTNTIILAAHNLIDALKQQPADVEYAIDKAKRIQLSGERIANLMKAVRGYARMMPNDGLSNIAEAIENVRLLIGSRLSESGITLWADVSDCSNIQVEVPDLETVLLNLIQNACDAIVSHGSNEKWVSIAGHRGLDNTVCITIEDSGGGISETVSKKIFDPFFTTKPVGQGTGLGLSTAFYMIRQAGGSIAFRNGKKGAIFCLKLPLHKVHGEAHR